MYKKNIYFVLVLSILFTGCYSWDLVQEPESDSTIRITTKNNEVYEMSTWYNENGTIIGDAGEVKKEGRFTKKLQTKIDKSDIEKIEGEKFNVLNTALFAAGALTAIIIIVALVWHPEKNVVESIRSNL